MSRHCSWEISVLAIPDRISCNFNIEVSFRLDGVLALNLLATIPCNFMIVCRFLRQDKDHISYRDRSDQQTRISAGQDCESHSPKALWWKRHVPQMTSRARKFTPWMSVLTEISTRKGVHYRVFRGAVHFPRSSLHCGLIYQPARHTSRRHHSKSTGSNMGILFTYVLRPREHIATLHNMMNVFCKSIEQNFSRISNLLHVQKSQWPTGLWCTQSNIIVVRLCVVCCVQ